jgi:dipeptidyl aminopeptidase/acylaminoacyl peptidase
MENAASRRSLSEPPRRRIISRVQQSRGFKMRASPTLRSALILGTGLLLSGYAPDTRSITDKDIWQFTWIGDPQISPDGSRIVYARVVVDSKHTGYETSIWSVPARGGDPERLTSGTHDSQPRWSPDGSRLAFVRSPQKDGKPAPPQIFVMSMRGGEPVQVSDVAGGAGGPQWSPDGKMIAFGSGTSPEDTVTKKPEDGYKSDVRYITKAVYRANGQGYLDFTHPGHIWVVEAPTSSSDKPSSKQLTFGKYDADDFFWAPDSKSILFTTLQVDEPYYEGDHADIYRVATTGGTAELVNSVKIGVQSMSPSPDGKRIAFRSSPNEPIQSYTEPDLYVLDLVPGAQPKNITLDYDYGVGDGVGGDNGAPRAGGGTRPIWSSDGTSIIDVVAVTGRANLMRFPVNTGKPVEITKGDHAVQRFSSRDGGKTIALLISTPTIIGDLYMLNPGAAAETRITNVNEKLMSQLNLTEPQEIWYNSFDGKKIQAWVQRPPNFDKSKKYPLILNIHGGPHTAYGWVFDHEFQTMAARGYVVLYPNPRGSTSYGQDFGNIIQYKYPGDDYKDLMAGVDELIREGYVDSTKMGVTGGSGGGVLTDWTVTQTNRFKAAVSQRDISNWAAWWYSADFWLYQPAWFRKPPFQDPQEYAARSAITYVDRIQTPIAFILGDADFRTPPEAGGEELFRALKWLKRPTAIVRFPNESHELSRSGQPWHRVERIDAIIGWFDKYLLGKDVAVYRDVTPAQ